MATFISSGYSNETDDPSPDGTSIKALHDSANCHDGDTIIFPVGSFVWHTPCVLTKAVKIQGSTTVDTNPNGPSANDQSILQDFMNDRSNGCAFQLQGNCGQEITGLTIGRGTTAGGGNGIIKVNAVGNPVNIHHIHFDACHFAPHVHVPARNFGIIHHCWMTGTSNEGIAHIHFSGPETNADDVRFTEPTNWGGSNFFFLEDNYTHGGLDVTRGSRVVVRHSVFVNAQAASHGTAQGYTFGRGPRVVDIYNNIWHFDPAQPGPTASIDECNGGCFIMHDNSYPDPPNITRIPLGVYRAFHSYGTPWFGADGRNPWDLNATRADGTHVDGEQPFLFDSGTLTGGPPPQDTSKNWTPNNKWVGYVIRRVSDGQCAIITGNSSNALTTDEWQPAGWGAGQAYEIRKCTTALDQPGMGQCDNLVNRSVPAWPNQHIEPCYQWNNTHGATPINFSVNNNGNGRIIAGVHYIDGVMPGYTTYTYPHPLQGVTSTTRIIFLSSPGGLAFGNVTIGSASPTAILTVANQGTGTLTVTGVSYPAAFTGSTGGFTVAAGSSFDITVTFTPLDNILYSGSITVSSDATSGSNTIATSGTGVDPVPPVHGHRRQARYAFS